MNSPRKGLVTIAMKQSHTHTWLLLSSNKLTSSKYPISHHKAISQVNAYCHSDFCNHWSTLHTTSNAYWGPSPYEDGVSGMIPDSKVHGAYMGPVSVGPTGPSWAPCWPHELCYLGWYGDRFISTGGIHIVVRHLYIETTVSCWKGYDPATLTKIGHHIFRHINFTSFPKIKLCYSDVL